MNRFNETWVILDLNTFLHSIMYWRFFDIFTSNLFRYYLLMNKVCDKIHYYFNYWPFLPSWSFHSNTHFKLESCGEFFTHSLYPKMLLIVIKIFSINMVFPINTTRIWLKKIYILAYYRRNQYCNNLNWNKTSHYFQFQILYYEKSIKYANELNKYHVYSLIDQCLDNYIYQNTYFTELMFGSSMSQLNGSSFPV